MLPGGVLSGGSTIQFRTCRPLALAARLRWSSGYDARLTRERSPVRAWDGVCFAIRRLAFGILQRRPSEKNVEALLAQWLERAAVNRKVTGSIPVGSGFQRGSMETSPPRKMKYLCLAAAARLAQSVERQPFKLVVVGSSPTVGASKQEYLI